MPYRHDPHPQDPKPIRLGAACAALLGIIATPGLAQTYVSDFGSGHLSCPISVGVDPISHNIFVGNYGNDHIVIFDSNRTYVSEFGGQGTGDGQFGSELDAITFDPATHHVFVSDRDNDRVEVFDANGHYLSQFPVLDSPVGALFRPSSNDLLVSADSGGVEIYNSSGTNTGAFEFPASSFIGGNLAFARNGDVLATQFGNPDVARYSASGDYLSSFGASYFTCPGGMAADPTTGNIFVVNTCGPDNVQIFSASGSHVGQLGGHGGGQGQFNDPQDAIFDPLTGNLLVTDCNNQRIQEFSTCGPTLVSLSVLPQTQSENQSIFFSGSISDVVSPGGEISFYSDGELICTAPTYGDPQAACSSELVLGSHAVKAVYSGDGVNQPGCSTPQTVTVIDDTAPLSTTVSLVGPPQGIDQGEAFTLEVTVSASSSRAAQTNAAPALTGFITFMDGTATLAIAPLDSNHHATYTNALAGGTHHFSAAYSGDGSYASASNSATVSIAKPSDDIFYDGLEVLPGN